MRKNDRLFKGHKKNMLTCVLMCLVIILLFQCSFAWFITAWDSMEEKFGFGTKTLDSGGVKMYMYNEDKTWEEKELIAQGDTKEDYAFPELDMTVNEVNGDTTITALTLNSLHMGTIDNLENIKNDNIFYLKYEIVNTPKNYANINVKYLSEDINIYKSTEILDEYKKLSPEDTEYATLFDTMTTINADTPFIQYEYCISSEDLTTGFENLKFSEKGDCTFSDPDPAVDLNGNLIEDGVTDGISGYLYIKIEPNLNAFGEAAMLLNTYMPCIVTFDIEAVFEYY